jgi:hypothetical protein
VKQNTIPMNVPFAKADLLSHLFRMCPYSWQDQYNLHKKGGTPVDMRSLLLSLEAIKCLCGQERYEKSNASHDKALHSNKRVQSNLVLTIAPESQRKLVPRNTVTFARSMGARTQCTILVIAISLRKTE